MKTIEKIVNLGYQDPVILGGQWHFRGGHGLTTGKPELIPKRDWRSLLAPFEPQKRLFDSSSCTQFATIKPTQAIIKLKYSPNANYSERALSIASRNSPYGNSPDVTAEALRKNGLTLESLLPFTDKIKSWEEYMTPNPLTKDLIKAGKKWGYKFNHEWVKTNPEIMWQALPYSILGVSVRAWMKEGEFFVKEKGERDTHWTDIVFGKYREYWIVDDSYLDDGERYKKLPWDYPFGYCKVYSVNKAQLKWPFNWFPNLWQ